MAGKKGMASGRPNRNAAKEIHQRGKAIHIYVPAKTYLALKAKHGDNTDKVIRQVALEAVEGLKEGGQDGEAKS